VAPRTAHRPFPAAFGLTPLGDPVVVTPRVSRWMTDAGALALKTYTASERTRGMQEAALLAFLGGTARDGAYRAQTLVFARNGMPWADDGERRVVATRWLPGEYRPYTTYSIKEWAALGGSLAALHQALDHWSAPLAETLSSRLRRIDPDVELARLALPSRELPEHPQITAEWVATYLEACRELLFACYSGALTGMPVDDPERPIHNDYNQFNYLFDGQLPPMILDWEKAIGAPREFEVVRCLNHLPLRAPGAATAFLDGYLGKRPLDASRLRWAVDVSCLMHATKHWVLEGWLEGREGFDERLLGAMEMTSMLSRGCGELAAFYIEHVPSPA
jgi:Ser/Thr protein kinase RdoA (MazF antagonist)